MVLASAWINEWSISLSHGAEHMLADSVKYQSFSWVAILNDGSGWCSHNIKSNVITFFHCYGQSMILIALFLFVFILFTWHNIRFKHKHGYLKLCAVPECQVSPQLGSLCSPACGLLCVDELSSALSHRAQTEGRGCRRNTITVVTDPLISLTALFKC